MRRPLRPLVSAGVLAADLDCTGVNDNAVLIHNGTLSLGGFTITGGWGVFCDGPCKVYGPGTVTGSTYFGINGFGKSLQVKNVTITNNGQQGIQSAGTCKVTGPMVISGNIGPRGDGIARSVTRLSATGSAAKRRDSRSI